MLLFFFPTFLKKKEEDTLSSGPFLPLPPPLNCLPPYWGASFGAAGKAYWESTLRKFKVSAAFRYAFASFARPQSPSLSAASANASKHIYI